MEILVLEASTTSAKAMLYHTEDGTFETKVNEYGENIKNAKTSDEAENVFLQVMATGKELLAGRTKVDMIALGGTWHSVMLCDANMVPKTPVYLWNYTGAANLCRDLRKDKNYVYQYYQRTGCMVNAIYPVFKLELLRRKGWKLEDYLFVSQGTYNTYRMTGRRVSTKCLSSGSGLLNIHTREYDPQILNEFGFHEEQLSQLVEYDETFPLNDEAAKLLGLQSGIPVIPTNADGGLNQVGVGALEKGVATFSVGTSGAIRLTTDQPILPENPSTWCYLSPKSWLSGAATNGCCNCVDWVRTGFFPEGTTYREIETEDTKIDSNVAPVFLPFLYGERCPGWDDDRQGGFLGLLPQHKSVDLYHAVLEGVLFNLYHCYRILADVNGEPKEIKISGGILHSPLWKQMCADIFNRTLTIDNIDQGSLLGGAVLAMELLGEINDVRDYRPNVVGVITPNPKATEMYRKKFQRYLDYYKCTK
ncbi:MAG: Gluconokinase [Oscillospiraceae bacterium]